MGKYVLENIESHVDVFVPSLCVLLTWVIYFCHPTYVR